MKQYWCEKHWKQSYAQNTARIKQKTLSKDIIKRKIERKETIYIIFI